MNEPSSALDTPLWQFALAIYMRDGVSAECIELQDRLGLNVNFLLFGAYAGVAEHVVLSRDALTAAAASVAGWQRDVVVPLREARRALKPWGAKDTSVQQEAEALRTTVKAAELDGERIELALLWSWLRSQDLPKTTLEEALRANLREVLTHYGSADVEPKTAVPHLYAAALAATRQV